MHNNYSDNDLILRRDWLRTDYIVCRRIMPFVHYGIMIAAVLCYTDYCILVNAKSIVYT